MGTEGDEREEEQGRAQVGVQGSSEAHSLLATTVEPASSNKREMRGTIYGLGKV